MSPRRGNDDGETNMYHRGAGMLGEATWKAMHVPKRREMCNVGKGATQVEKERQVCWDNCRHAFGLGRFSTDVKRSRPIQVVPVRCCLTHSSSHEVRMRGFGAH